MNFSSATFTSFMAGLSGALVAFVVFALVFQPIHSTNVSGFGSPEVLSPSPSNMSTILNEPTASPSESLSPAASAQTTPTKPLNRYELEAQAALLSAIKKSIEWSNTFPSVYSDGNKYQLVSVKKSFTNTSFVFTFSVAKWLAIDPDNPFEFTKLLWKSKCVYERREDPSIFSGDYQQQYVDWYVETPPLTNVVVLQLVDAAKKFQFPHEPSKWIYSQTFTYSDPGFTFIAGGTDLSFEDKKIWGDLRGCPPFDPVQGDESFIEYFLNRTDWSTFP